MIKLLYKTLFAFLIILFVATIGIFAWMQTPWGKKHLLSSLTHFSQANNIDLSIKQINGSIPLNCILSDVKIKTSSYLLTIDSVSFKISLLPLLFKTIHFEKFTAKNINIKNITPSSPSFSSSFSMPTDLLPLPYTIVLKSFDLNNLSLFQDPSILLNLKGKIKVDKNYGLTSCDILATRKQFDNSSARFVLKMSKIKSNIKTRTTIDAKTTQFLSPFVTIPIDGFCKLDTKGPTQSYIDIFLSSNASTAPPILSTFEATIRHTKSADNFFANSHLSSQLKLFANKKISLEDFSFKNTFLTLTGHAQFINWSEIEKAQLSLHSKNLSLFNKKWLKGFIHAQADIIIKNKTPVMTTNYSLEELQIDSVSFDSTTGTIKTIFHPDAIEGQWHLSTICQKIPFDAQVQYQWTNKQDLIHFSSLQLQSLFTKTKGDFFYSLSNQLFNGNIDLFISDLSQLENFYSLLTIEGNAVAHIQLTPNDKEQAAKVDLLIDNFSCFDFFSRNMRLQLAIDDLFSQRIGDLYIRMNHVDFRGMVIADLSLFTSNREENWPFSLDIHGEWKDPLNLSMTGFWRIKDAAYTFTIQQMYGDMLSHAYSLPKPVQIEWSKNHFVLNDFIMELASSSLTASINLEKDNYDVRILLDHFPIDFLSFNPLELKITGYTSSEILLKKSDNETNGNVHIDLDEMHILALAEDQPLVIKGVFHGTLNNNVMNAKAQLKMRENEYLEMQTSLPIILDVFPFKFTLIDEKPLSAEILFNGKIEEIIDFFNTGSHKFEGDMTCHLTLSNTVSDPNVQGFCRLKNGLYENYYTGTFLKDLTAEISANKHKLIIQNISAKDIDGGDVSASGYVLIDINKNFPFDITAHLNDLTCVQSDLIVAQAKGDIAISGNIFKAKAKGKIKVTQANVTIPDKLPEVIPDLPVTIINQKKMESSVSTTKLTPIHRRPFFPLDLDIIIFADKHIDIEGKGLFSTWKGAFHITGSFTDIIAKGQLELIKGRFDFAGRDFNLTKGSVAMAGKSREVPFINVSATTQIQGTTIVANLYGPINQSTLRFSSVPALPESSIMSFLIFGQDISEISGLQALQLAAAMASFSDSANILEATRKTLGIDRLTIKTTPTTQTDNPEQISVQLGKYITRGVMVSLSQGLEQGSSNIIVEIDLKRGFIFQAETQQQEEQGKFTLKWNYNY